MSNIQLTKEGVVFSGNNGTKILLNTRDFLSNKSRVAMHSFSADGDTIPNFLTKLLGRNRTIFQNTNTVNDLRNCMLNALVVSKLVTSAAPMKVAEFGSTNGDISYNLTETLGKINPKSTLCLISDRIGNESSNTCLNYITQAEVFPEFQMLYSDYTTTNLADELFDIVVINGDVCFEDSYKVIKEAERVTKTDGLILCWTSRDYLLESTFKLIFSEREEYELTPHEKILTVKKPAESWSNCTANEPYAGLVELVTDLKNTIGSNDPAVYRPYVKQLNQYIDIAIEKYDIQRKLQLIELKEAILYYMTHLSTEHEEFYLEKLNKALDIDFIVMK